ncbi:hypothetical protein J4228_02680, partial [Candidatus Woesearchaeota archaeon]|nr:hypothetical protein [Candidatus Woesearchaeota archaeon]
TISSSICLVSYLVPGRPFSPPPIAISLTIKTLSCVGYIIVLKGKLSSSIFRTLNLLSLSLG